MIIMTVIIAALYDYGKGAVLIGDKLRTGTHPLDKKEVLIERDDITKIYKLNNNVTVATSGIMEFWAEILKEIHEAVGEKDNFLKVRKIIERVYHRHFIRYQWSKVPGFFGFADMEDFLKRGAQIMTPLQLDKLNDLLIKTVAPGEMVLVGKGKEIYEIYTLSDPGIFKYSSSGLALTGSGTPYASRYVNENHEQGLSKDEVVRVLSEGKRLAEEDIHVGAMTDLKILD